MGLLRVVCLGVLGLLSQNSEAAAHALGAECRLKGDKVEVEAFYDDDSPAAKAAVRVLGPDGKTVAEGKTDSQGRWLMVRPAAGKYQVIVEAAGGHRAEKLMVIPDKAQGTESQAVRVSEGPSREEFTAFPWLKMAIGLVAIAALGIGLFIAKRNRQPSVSSPPH